MQFNLCSVVPMMLDLYFTFISFISSLVVPTALVIIAVPVAKRIGELEGITRIKGVKWQAITVHRNATSLIVPIAMVMIA